jgi:hypothetical protein
VVIEELDLAAALWQKARASQKPDLKRLAPVTMNNPHACRTDKKGLKNATEGNSSS